MQVGDALMKLLSGYLTQSLPSETDSGDSSSLVIQIQAEAAANAAILLCLALKTEAQLWASVYPKFEAARCSATFLQLLSPHILRNQLTSLAPAVMQVHSFASRIFLMHTMTTSCKS